MIWFRKNDPSSSIAYHTDVSVDSPLGHVQLRSLGASSPYLCSLSKASVTGKKLLFFPSLEGAPCASAGCEEPVLWLAQGRTYSQLPQPDMVC